MSEQTKPRRGRPRDPSKDRAVLTATQKLLGAHGFHQLRIDDVASAARVPKSTIYRRWPSLHALAVDAYAIGVNRIDLEHTDDAWKDYVHAVDVVHKELSSNPLARNLPVAGVALTDENDLHERFIIRFIEPADRWMHELIERGKKAGQLKPTLPTDDIVKAVIGFTCFYLSCQRSVPTKDAILGLSRELMGPVKG